MGDWTGYLLLILDGAWVTVRLTVMGCALALVVARGFPVAAGLFAALLLLGAVVSLGIRVETRGREID